MPPAKYGEHFHHIQKGLISMQRPNCLQQRQNTGTRTFGRAQRSVFIYLKLITWK